QADQPEAQAEAERGCERAVEDGNRARRAAEKDRLGQRAMDRHRESGNCLVHHTSAPPPKEKKLRKKLEAAKAMERPNTICTSLRKPPAVSPNARVRPVTVMMMTAMIL